MKAALTQKSKRLHAGSLMLGTACLSILGYEHSLSQPVIRLWNGTHHVLTANENEGVRQVSSLQPTR